jgi:hypothetical protein
LFVFSLSSCSSFFFLVLHFLLLFVTFIFRYVYLPSPSFMCLSFFLIYLHFSLSDISSCSLSLFIYILFVVSLFLFCPLSLSSNIRTNVDSCTR